MSCADRDGTWPSWATEPVRIREYDPGWPRRAGELARRLDGSLARWRTRAVEHVGSTAVPGSAAKPILDLQVAVADLSCAAGITAVLAPSGWHLVPPELDRRS